MKISKGTNYSTKALRPNMWTFGFYVVFFNYYYLSKVKLFQIFDYSKTHCFNSSCGCQIIFVFFGVVEPNGCYLCIHEWRSSRKKHVELEGFEVIKKDGVLVP
jgi:hypothetical protein